MDLELIRPLAYIFGGGLLAGLVVGFALRKLNKVVAAFLGLSFLSVNILWLIRILELDLDLPPQINAISDVIATVLPQISNDLKRAIGPALTLTTTLPFVGGFIFGGWIGFKLA
ncbi:MAG: FUN14 domain-containing protein [Candidatus Bathyarchaeota archaeon]|jgi:uncharacterized membrane protein (Fun14 family)